MARNEGKYAAVVPGLRPAPPADVGYQAKVDAEKARIGRQEPTTLAALYVGMRQEKERIERTLSPVNLRIAALEQLLAESQEMKQPGWGAYGVKDNAIRLASGDTVRVNREPQGKVVDKEAFRLWCIANGYERQLQLWPSTMNGIVKERLLAGEPEPDGCEAYSYAKVSFVKGGEE